MTQHNNDIIYSRYAPPVLLTFCRDEEITHIEIQRLLGVNNEAPDTAILPFASITSSVSSSVR